MNEVKVTEQGSDLTAEVISQFPVPPPINKNSTMSKLQYAYYVPIDRA